MSSLQVALARSRDAMSARTALREWQRAQAHVPEEAAVLVYFGSGAQYLYQIRDWLPPLEVLADKLPVALVVRDPRAALLLRHLTTIPIVLARWLADLDAVMTRYQPRAVLYVNQNVSNFDLLAYAAPQHVFLSHGESDKVYMVSNQAKAYDLTFVAGQAAVDRYAAALHDFDTATKLRIIGRPQLHIPQEPPADLPPSNLPTVLYAPTTEGSGEVMEYGSLASHGVAMVSALLASGAYRVIFRPHPQAGRRLAAHADAKATIERMLSAPHYVDTTPRFGWQQEAADALVCDISAVAVDWLTTSKPLVVTRPASRAPVLEGGMLADLPLLAADRAGDVVTALVAASSADEMARLQGWADYYFAPGDVATFVDAVCDVVGR